MGFGLVETERGMYHERDGRSGASSAEPPS